MKKIGFKPYLTASVQFFLGFALLAACLVFAGTFNCAVAYDRGSHKTDTGNTGQIIIKIADSAEVESGEVFLRDVATVHAGHIIKEKLNGIRIAKSPPPGMKRPISYDRILSAIRSRCRNINPSIVKRTETVQVLRSCQKLSLEEVKKLLKCHMEKEEGVPAGDGYSIENIKINSKHKFPLGRISMAVTRHNPSQLLGSVKFNLSVTVEGYGDYPVSVSAWISRYEKVVYARRAMKRGMLIQDEDICLKRANISKMPKSILKDRLDAVGKILKRGLHAGAYLRENMLETPRMVKKGDQVEIRATNGILDITAKGVAKTGGYKNDQIRVQNISSKRTVVGRILDGSTVLVKF